MPRLDAGGLPIRRNTFLLAASLTASSGTLQLVAAVSSLTFVLVTGVEGLLGLGPAIFLASAALSAFPQGRAMDRFGRVPVLVSGYAFGVTGSLLTALGTWTTTAALVIPGFMLIGVSAASATLTRTAAGDMYPPERRARGIALVLFGAVFGAVLGPAVFSPLLTGRDLTPRELAIPWIVAAGFQLVALTLVASVHPDPRRIAELIGVRDDVAPAGSAAPLGELLKKPGVVPALLAAVASFAVMVSVMNLTGYVVVHNHHHHEHTVFPIIGAHVLGMYALVLVVGNVIDRLGRRPPLVGGLALMSASCVGLLWAESVWGTAVLLFGLGLGWNLSFVAATTELVDRTSAAERGKLLGFADLLSGLTGASLALLGGFALKALGVAALGIGAGVLVVLPALWILRDGRRRAEPALATISDR